MFYLFYCSESEVHAAASASQNQLTDAEQLNTLSLTSLRKKDEMWVSCIFMSIFVVVILSCELLRIMVAKLYVCD
jgi:hypothetical protein